MRINLFVIFLLIFQTVFSQNESLKKDLEILSHDSLQGRLVGSDGEKIGAKYISDSYQAIGLKPLILSDFYQPFETNYQTNPHDSTLNRLTSIKSQNVIGFLDNGASKTFLIGAHYDHLGLNEYGQSSAPDEHNQIHNGADDNASGVAGVLELARRLTTNNQIENANFIFACFSGEEIGLIGSQKFIEFYGNQIHLDLMVNMDMIGRLDSLNQLFIGGIGTSPNLPTILQNNQPAYFKLVMDSSGVGPSDHTSFYHHKVPVLFFHTGSHQDYHKPSDDFEKINFNGLSNIISYIEKIIVNLTAEQELVFTPTKLRFETRKTSLKVTLGIMPSYSSTSEGLQIDHVIENKPAFNAGLTRGDLITAIDDCKITDITTYINCLSQLEKGALIKVAIIRNTELKVIDVQL